MELRPATEADLPALHATFTDAIESVFRPRGFDAPTTPFEVFSVLQRHVMATGTCAAAVDDDGQVVGYASSWTRDQHWFLSSLFVRERAQGRGVGPQLLDAVWGEAGHRRTVTDAIQPVSNVLYGRRGLLPATPVLTFSGTPHVDDDDAVDESPADVDAIDELVYGFDRSVDHAYWLRHAERREWGDAYSYRFPGGQIGPVAGLTPEAAARAFAAELSRADGPVPVRIPGSAGAILEVALRARLTLGAAPGLLLLSKRLRPPTALAPSGYQLF